MVSTDVAQSKSLLRAKFKAQLAHSWSRTQKSQTDCDASILRQIETLVGSLIQGRAAVFLNRPDEPDLSGLCVRLKHWQWAYPLVDGEKLRFYIPKSSAAFRLGAFGIREPDPEQSDEVDVHQLQVVCLPGVAFDRTGRRLGRGKGFYDRALVSFKGKKIGIGYTAQISDELLPAEAHDVFMDFVVTENLLLKLKG